MSKIKSFYVDRGKDIRGDMFYIKHDSMNFTMIDCCLKETEERRGDIISEIQAESVNRICRFISTHPHDDHIHGIDYLNQNWEIINFYAVDNDRTGQDESFKAYLKLKENQPCPLERDITRKWLNIGDNERGSSGIFIHWPVLTNPSFQEALKHCQDDPNAISAVIEYRTKYFRVLWMGDMETEMQEAMFEEIGREIGKIDVLFLPHHGRSSANLPKEWLEELDPRLIIVGAAPSDEIDYDHYDSNKTLTQNTALDFELIVTDYYIHVFTEGDIDNAPSCLVNRFQTNRDGMIYQGSLPRRQ
jgi:beta-lactamase superfamily II metal-dependent hydrolase